MSKGSTHDIGPMPRCKEVNWKCWAKSAARGTLICLIKGLSVHMTHHDASFYSCISTSFFVLRTPLKLNMEHEDGPLEKEIPFGKTHHAEILE